MIIKVFSTCEKNFIKFYLVFQKLQEEECPNILVQIYRIVKSAIVYELTIYYLS